MGWSALGRLARLEQDEASSKYAALAILRQPWPTEAELPATLAALPSPTLTSKRRAVEWLKTYASTLREPSSTTAAWTKLVDEEFALLAKDKTRTSPLLATQLARWQVEYLRRVKQETIALKTLEHLASTIDPSQEDQLQEHIDWLADLEMWTLVVETERRFAAKFAENGPLLYRVAEAKLKLGDKATATELAEKAFQLNGDQIPLHVLAGQVLAQKGLFEWAEREYREALRIGSIGTMYDISIRSTLSELFHDQGEEQKAVDVLKPLVDASEKDEKVRQLIERSGRELDSIKSRMHHFVAIGHLTAGRFKEAEENFRLSFEEDSENIDAMIALYRLPNQTPEVRKRTLDDLHELIQESQRQITTHKRELEEADTANEQAYYKLRLAKDHNDYSWLVGNTEGDIDSAIRSSHESLKLRPGTAAYLDTLGRAYYSKGDYASAEKYQLEALRLEPHSGMMKRQLELIRNAAKSGTSKAAEKN
jgi:tetratricopeptide (TPR) repeat protein